MILRANRILVALVILAMVAVNTYFPGDPVREGKLVLFYLAALLAGAFWVGERLDKPLGALIAFAAVVWFVKGLALYGMTMVAGSLAFLFLAKYLVDHDEKLLWQMLRLAMLFEVGMCFLEMAGYQPLYQAGVQGSFGHPMASSVFFAMLFPIALKKWSSLEAGLMVIMVIVAGSSCGAIALISGALFYYRKRMGLFAPALLAAFVAFCIMGAVFLPFIEAFSFSGRFLPWSVAYRHILHDGLASLLIGHGPGSWFGLYSSWGVNYERIWDFLHSDPLQLIFELGMIGGLLGLLASISLVFRAPTWIGAAMVAMLVNSLGGFPFHLPASAFLFCVLIAAASNHRNKQCVIS